MVNEYIELSRELEQYHSVFQLFWEMGSPAFTDRVETAAIEFNKDGQFASFLFNPEFYDNISIEKKAFVIAHEALHVILNHGQRGIVQNEIKRNSNIAMDLVINHMLVRDFGMNRKNIDPDNEYCWVDTVFKEKVENNLSYEAYYNLLEIQKSQDDGQGNGFSQQTVDDHSYINESLEESITDDALEQIAEKLGEEAGEKLIDVIDPYFEDENSERGTSALGQKISVNKNKVVVKRKWETIISDWVRTKMKIDFSSFEHWARINRRGSILPEDIILPSEMEIEDYTPEKDKIFVYFFLDTSGSCAGLSQRFFDCARSLPPDKMEVKYFSFDTEVYEADMETGQLRGWGGTSFDIMEHQIQRDIREKVIDSYPDAVFVLTDGWGNRISPQYPDRWKWMLTEYSSKDYIPAQSTHYLLKDYE